MTTLLCINPNSRSGESDCQPFVEKLQSLGPVIEHVFDDDNPLQVVLDQYGSSLKRIVVGGGDGTINRVLGDIKDRDLILGVLPLGTANDFARSLNLPSDPEEALDAVLKGQSRRIDLGEANGNLFVNAAGIGIGPKLTKAMNHERKQRFGVLAYFVSFLEVMGLNWWRYASIYIDGKRKRKKFMQITIANGVHYGGGMTIAQDADLDDSKLRILCLSPQSIWQLIAKYLTLRLGFAKGEHKQPGMRLYEAKRATVTTRKPVDVSVDGELLTTTPLQCRVIPNAIEVYFKPEDE